MQLCHSGVLLLSNCMMRKRKSLTLPSWQYTTISMTKQVYVYKFTVHCMVYSKLLLQVTSLQHIKYFTANCCHDLQVTDQSVSYYTFAHLFMPINEQLHFCTVDSLFLNQSVSYYTFSLLLSQSMNYYTFLHCSHVQNKNIIYYFYCTVVSGAYNYGL